MDDKNNKALIDAFAADKNEQNTLAKNIMALAHESEKASPQLAAQFINDIVSKDWASGKRKH